MDIIIDFLFFFDIILNFRTSFIDPLTGDEIKDGKKITINYICGGRFVIDLLAIIPFDYVVVNIIQVEASSTNL